MKTEQVITTDYGELDKLICEYFNMERKDWTCVACWEMGNDSSKTVTISKENHGYDPEEIQAAREDGEQYGHKVRYGYSGPELLMTIMCMDGKLDEGKYVVDICW